MSSSKSLKLGIPKGSLEASTLAVFEKVGLHFSGAHRSLWLRSNDPEITPILLKPQEIPTYVRSGHLDAGLTGLDWIVEQDALDHVCLLAELPYSRKTAQPIRWVLAVPDESPVFTLDDLRAECDRRSVAGNQFTIATEITRIANAWLAKNGIEAHAEFSWGATEAKASYFSDAIVEGTETGASLRANHLRVVAEVFRSTSHFFANRIAYRTDAWKRSKLDGIAHLIAGAVLADDLVQLTVIADRHLDLLSLLDGDARIIATIGPTESSPFQAIVTLDRATVPRAMPAVIAAGASDAWIAPLSVYYSSASRSSADLSRMQSLTPPATSRSGSPSKQNLPDTDPSSDLLIGAG